MDAAVKAYQNVAQKEFRDQLVAEHLDCVRHVLGRLLIGLPGFLDEDNLESAGILGLVEAASHFDPSRGVNFRTYAYHRVRGAILDELRRNCPLPQHVLQQWSRIRKAWEQLGEHANGARLAQFCQLSEEEVEHCMQAVRLVQPESWQEEMRLNRRHQQTADPSDSLDRSEQVALLADAIEQLPERSRIILSLYYMENLRLAEIAEVLNLSQSRVSRLLTHSQLQLKLILEQKMRESD